MKKIVLSILVFMFLAETIQAGQLSLVRKTNRHSRRAAVHLSKANSASVQLAKFYPTSTTYVRVYRKSN